MYLHHYQLKLMPFEIGPDPRFLWLGEKHEEAFAILQYGILESKGFIVIIGEPGTGKSTLLNATVANFGSDIRFAKISDPALNEMDFFNVAANALQMGKSFLNKAEFLIQLESFVQEAGAQFKKVIFVIDEAQRLRPETLEQIRVFSNVELPGQKVVSCIFAGQPEFLDMIRKNRALNQRIFLSHIIQPLTRSETEEYIAHRLKVAGRDEPLFSPAAVQEIFRLSKGNPRLINILCDQALLIGYSNQLKTIGPETVRESTKNASARLTAPPTAAEVEPKTETVERPPSIETATAGAAATSRIPAQSAQSNPTRRRTVYLALSAFVVLLALAAFDYLNGGFRMTSIVSRKDTGPASGNAPSPEASRSDDDLLRLQSQILGLRKEKEEAETHLRELRARFESLESEHRQLADIAHRASAAEGRSDGTPLLTSAPAVGADELKNLRERAAQLEAAVAEREKKLNQVEQGMAELEKMLVQERGKRSQMGAELSSRQAEIADFQNKLDAAKGARLKLERDVETIRSENARLQAQIQELKAQKPDRPASAALRPGASAAPPAAASSEPSGEAPDPADAIDFLIRKKSR